MNLIDTTIELWHFLKNIQKNIELFVTGVALKLKTSPLFPLYSSVIIFGNILFK
jgi:hypothetical protein